VRPVAAVLVALATAGCGQDQGLLPCAEGDCVTGWSANCQAVALDLRCALVDPRSADVTAEAVWGVSGPAVVEAPGSIRIAGYGEVVIAVAHRRAGIGTIEAGRFLADPPFPPRRIWWLAGSVVRASDLTALAGVRVTVTLVTVSGDERRSSAVTDARGQFRMEGVVTGEDLRWSAEKPGYATRSGGFRLPDPTGAFAPDPAPRLDLRLVQEPWRPAEAAR
jgi:hypothetical protein